jgi:hypothetical protein
MYCFANNYCLIFSFISKRSPSSKDLTSRSLLRSKKDYLKKSVQREDLQHYPGILLL